MTRRWALLSAAIACACGAPHVEAPATTEAVPEFSDPEPGDVASPAYQFLKLSLLGAPPHDPRLGSDDPDQSRAFIEGLITELEPLYARDSSSADLDQLAKTLGVEPVDSPFKSLTDKFWGAGLVGVVEAVQPTMKRAIWSEADFALVRRFGDYIEMGPLDPPLELTGTDRRHDLAELERFVGGLSERFEDCQFRGGIAFSFTGGPYRPVMLVVPEVLEPQSRLALTPDLELRVCEVDGRSPCVQAVDTKGAVAWTCELKGTWSPMLFTGEFDGDSSRGWGIRLMCGRRPTGLHLDGTGMPCYYFIPFD